MPKFVRKNAIVLTWTHTSCKVLNIQRDGNKLVIKSSWSGEVSKEQSLTSLLAEGFKAVAGDSNQYVIASGDGTGWGSADLTMPKLKGEELKNALGFELRKQTPMPVEKLRWGYRRLPGGTDKSDLLRLFYIRSEKWSKWLEALGAIHHLDLVCPPELALSPLGSEGKIILPDSEGNPLEYRYDAGQWLSAPCSLPENYSLDSAIPGLACEVSGLPASSPEEKLAWMPAIFLGAYSMTAEASADSATLISLPEDKRPRRHTALKGLALAIIIYLVLILAFGLTRQFQARTAHLRKISMALEEVNAKIHDLRGKNQTANLEFAKKLRQEMLDNVGQGPDFADALAEISRIITPPSWISQKLEWNSGLITMQVQSMSKDLELASRLEESPILGDVREQNSAFRSNAYITRYTLNVRNDTPEEAEALKKKLAQRAEAARQKRLEAESRGVNLQADEQGYDEDDPAGLINDDEIIIID